MFSKEVILLCFVINILQSLADFSIPEATLVAYKPRGFRASIPAISGIQMYAFHGNLNKEITQVDPGEFSKDFTSPTNNMWTYFDDQLSLKVGDVINYWIFVQYDKLGYRKDAQKWNVTHLVNLSDASCENSPSVVARKSIICKSSLILEDNFNTSNIDTNKWIIEEYIPYNSKDYEFVSYQNKPDVCYINEDKLLIKPKYAQNENQIRGELDLRQSCTKHNNEDECYQRQNGVFILPPVTSAKLVSSLNFRFGRVEIKAKLPAGDWIYPQIYLEQVNNPSKKLWIAYARGNNKLLANSGEDIGSRLLFGGPVLQAEEPDRSTYLKTKRNNDPFTSQMHIYTVIWTEDQILLQVDGNEYGKIDTRTTMQDKFAENEMARLVLGVSVGGVNDFPDNFKSGQNEKPWQNRKREQVRNFFDARNIWSKTWDGDKSALKVEYVKIYAL